jgi:hypothetical protein
VLGVVNSAISLGYYARIVQRMYLVEPDTLLPGDGEMLARAAAGGAFTGPPVAGLAGARPGTTAVATVATSGTRAAGRPNLLEEARPGLALASAGGYGAGGAGSWSAPSEGAGVVSPEQGEVPSSADWGLWAALIISFILTMLLGVAPRLLFSALGS